MRPLFAGFVYHPVSISPDVVPDERPQSSLKDLLVESRPYDSTCTDPLKCTVCSKSPIPIRCTQKDIVYQIDCGLCGAVYVGETSRPLKVRYQEHYRSAANPTAKGFTKHFYIDFSGGQPKMYRRCCSRVEQMIRNCTHLLPNISQTFTVNI